MDDDEVERRYNIIAEARETLARIAHVTVEQRSYHDDPLTRWAASMPKREPEPAPVQRKLTDTETLRWEQYIDGKIAAAINRHTEIWREVMAQALASERKRHRAEVEKLDLRLSGLLSEVTKRQTIEAAERRDNGGVIELPRFLGKRSDAARS